jgi:hypothetical protein
MNLFAFFRAEIVRLVDDLAAGGTLPAGLDTTRIAVEPPREATSPAMPRWCWASPPGWRRARWRN